MEKEYTNTPSQNELITGIPEHLISETARTMAAKAINVYKLPVHEEEIPVHHDAQGGRFNNGVVPAENGRFNNGIVVLVNGRYKKGTEPGEKPNQ